MVDEQKGPTEILGDFVEGKRRILFNFSRALKEEDNLGRLAAKWGYGSGGGRFNIYVNELVRDGYLKRYSKRGKGYLKITFRGEIAILPLIMPRLLMLFTLVLSLTLFDECIPPLFTGGTVSLGLIATIGSILLVFSLLGLFMLNRMEKFLLGIR
jgi:hypothetical protein